MVPQLISEIGEWLDRFHTALDRWEKMLHQIKAKYSVGDYVSIESLCPIGEGIHSEIQSCKTQRQQLLASAASLGYVATSLKELARQLDANWPALWTHRLFNMEFQLSRIHQLSTSLWVTAFQSRSFVTEMLLILATGKSDRATYSPEESSSLEGGFIINEAA